MSARSFNRRSLLVAGGAVLVTACAVDPTRAGASTRWGLAVDLEACGGREGCRACIDACHSAHRVPPVLEPRHQIRWLEKAPFAQVFPETTHPWTPAAQARHPVVILCNHCAHPPCTRACPTGATWQRADGVVAMDTHRCIGCRYCMVACPYGARSFRWGTPAEVGVGPYPARSTGVVEKCSLCVEQIDVGLPPRCVTACRESGAAALVFGDLGDPASPIRRLLASRRVLRRRPALGTEPYVFYVA